MTTPCYGCKQDLKWHVRDDASEIAKTKQALNAFLSSVGGGTALSADPPNITYFCAKCWALRMGVAEESVASGSAPPAQTLGTDDGGLKCKGIAFASTHKAYKKEGTEDYDIGRVAFVYCHELMHWYSHNHTGFQGLGKGIWGINWDEMTTDYLAANIFPNMRQGDKFTDLTFYNNDFVKFPELLARGFHANANMTGWKKENWEAALQNVRALNDPDAVTLADALASKDAKKTAKIWLNWYFAASAKLKPFLDCFDAIKTGIVANEIKTLTQETEYMASCAKGFKRPTWDDIG